MACRRKWWWVICDIPDLISWQVTYELQPPSYTSLKLLTGPPRGAGGDTLWSSQYAAYDLLSSGMQKYLECLTALHSAEEQAEGSRALGRPIRREPVITEHPLIRVNPVTGWKSLFYSPGFVKAIKGIPKMESDAIMAYLDHVIIATQEIHARYQWSKGMVVFWDNRSCVSSRYTYSISPKVWLSLLESHCYLWIYSSSPSRNPCHASWRTASVRSQWQVTRGGVAYGCQ